MNWYQWIKEIYLEIGEEKKLFLDLLPEYGISREERIEKNAIVRKKLPELSNYAIIDISVWGHELSRREMIKRLREQRFNFKELFFLLGHLFSGLYFVDQTKIIRKLIKETKDEIERTIPSVDQKEIKEITEIFSRDGDISIEYFIEQNKSGGKK